MSTYLIRQMPRLSVVFTTLAGADVDPDNVSCTVRHPNGKKVVYTYGTDMELIKDDIGRYHIDLLLDSAKLWYIFWEASGTYFGAGDHSLEVRSSPALD